MKGEKETEEEAGGIETEREEKKNQKKILGGI